MKQRHHFTIIELYVTIVILAVMGGLFWSSADALRQRSRQASCVDNLRTLYKSWTAYAADNNDCPPPLRVKINNTGKSHLDNVYWASIMESKLPNSQHIKAYVPSALLSQKSLLCCPEEPTPKRLSSAGVHYGMNYRIFQGPEKDRVKVSDLVKSPQTALFVDANSYVAGSTWGFRYVRFRHLNGINAVFTDGHVEWLGQNEVTEKNVFPWRF